jgi:MFS family permease
LIVTLGVGGSLLAVVFVLHERRTAEPIIPMQMFKDPVFVVCVSMAALLGAVLVAASAFLPLFLQVVKGASATSSGFLLVPMMVGLVIGSNVTGRIVNWTGRYKIFMMGGTALAVVGVFLLVQVERGTPRSGISLSMTVLGLGMGAASPITTLAVQNTASAATMGAATSAVNFFRSLGSAFGIAIFGAIMTSRLTSTVGRMLPGSDLLDNKALLNSPAAIRALPPKDFLAVSQGITNGLHTVFLVGLPFVAAAAVLAWFLKEVPLRDDLGATIEGMEEAIIFSPASDDHAADAARREDVVRPEDVTPAR